MSTDHQRRIWKVCDDHLRQAAMGEPYGLFVAFTFAPKVNPANRRIESFDPAWFVMVSIRNSGLGQPDIGNGAPVFGVLPPDEAFRQAVTQLLEMNRKERDSTGAIALLDAQRQAAIAANGKGQA